MKKLLGLVVGLGLVFSIGLAYSYPLDLDSIRGISLEKAKSPSELSILSFENKSGQTYSMKKHDTNFFSSVELLEYMSISLNVGWAYETEAIVNVLYDVTSAIQAIPFLNVINQIPSISISIGGYYGYDCADGVEDRNDYGLNLVYVAIKI